jgi:cell wall-associated NlpC family hydrolase
MTEDGGRTEVSRLAHFPLSDIRHLSPDTQRAAVVAEARKWVGTPYHNCADIKGVGVDCGMLLVRVFVDTGLVAPFDPRPYPSDWYLHRSEERYLGFISARVTELLAVVAPRPGDIVVMRFGRCYSHGGIVTRTAPFTMVHAYAPARFCLEEEISHNPTLTDKARAPRYFTHWPSSAGAQSGLEGGALRAAEQNPLEGGVLPASVFGLAGGKNASGEK